MKLSIDTSSTEKIVLKLNDKIYETGAQKEKSQRLLPFIKEVLIEQNASFNDLTEIQVVTGPGSFTGLRVGVTVAQTLGWALDIPVNGEKLSQKHFIEINY